MKNMFESTPAMNELLRRSGSLRFNEAWAASRQLAKAFELPIRQGVMSGDIHSDIFTRIKLAAGSTPEFPLDFLAPGTEKDFVAYTIPNQGRIPERSVEGDYVMVPTYDVGSSIDYLLKYARDARWDIVGRALEVLESSIIKKVNDDAWHLLLNAGVDRNILVFDADANAGQFTKRLVSLMKTIMRRNGGGNSASNNRRKLTDLYLSPESLEDIRNWGIDILDEFTRREVFQAEDGVMTRLFGVFLHDIDELGEGQEYQSFFTDQLAGTLASGDVELLVGLDLTSSNTFIMPSQEDLQTFEDPMLHRQRRAGYYSWMNMGVANLDNRHILLGSA